MPVHRAAELADSMSIPFVAFAAIAVAMLVSFRDVMRPYRG
jgi:hypothetical protein